MNIKEVREKYPQYSDMADHEIADAFHKKYYSDMPKEQVYQRMGISSDQQGNKKNSMLSEVLRQIGHVGAGALQGVAKAGQGIGELETGLFNKLFGTNIESPEADLLGGLGIKPDLATTAGEIGGDIGMIATGGGVLSKALKGALPAIRGAGLLSEAGGYGAAAAGMTPGGGFERGLAGTLGAALPVGLSAVKQVARHTLPSQLGKHLKNVYSKLKNESDSLYDLAFKGTHGKDPVVSKEAIDHIDKLLSQPGTSKIKDAVTTFRSEPSVEKLHKLQSDLGKASRRLNAKELKSGLDSTEVDTLGLINKLRDFVSKDVRENLKTMKPENVKKYEDAQEHYRTHIVPFKDIPSFNKLRGPQKEISNALLRELSKTAASPKRVRELSGLSKTGLKIGKTARNPLIGLPFIGTTLGFGAKHLID